MSQYAEIQDLYNLGLPKLSVTNIDPAVLDAQLVAASGLMDGYLGGRYNLPLLMWDASLTMQCCWIAAWLVLAKSRGFNPDNPGDVTIRTSYEDAISWCNGVQRQAIHPQVTETPIAAPRFQLPQVYTGVPRGWGNGRGV